jgi:hypothetical protein
MGLASTDNDLRTSDHVNMQFDPYSHAYGVSG